MVKTVLMVAFHYPPQRGSSGIQRTVKFAQYLPRSGWEPLVLTAHPRAYTEVAEDPITAASASGPTVVRRAFALDTSRHLAFRGRYAGLLALPDRWISWWFGALPAGLRMVRRYRPDVIWSTYPIATAHLIGLTLHRLTGIPWVADLRDPMLDPSYPTDPLMRRAAAWVEAQTVRHCARAVCTTAGAVRSYRQRYPHIPAHHFRLIENGYDEEDFAAAAEAAAANAVAATPGLPFTLVHSGIIYPSERDPVPLFQALATLLEDGRLSPQRFRLVLRAPVHVDLLARLARQHGIESIVTIAPHLPYRAALAEMLDAGGLLLLQAANCNQQVPAKLYEYLRARRPILALTDSAGDTAATLRAAGIDTIGPLDSPQGIIDALLRFLALAEAGTAPLAPPELARRHARSARSVQLAMLLDEVTEEARTGAGARAQGEKSSNAP
jgi:glycosyltransferase involved in cell wall biosynthesis